MYFMSLFRSKITPAVILVISLLISVSCRNNTGDGLIIISRTSSSLDNPDFSSGDSWRYLSNASIIAIRNDKTGKKPVILTKDFSSACSPSISYDGKKMLFAGQLEKDDPWQIWEMNLSNRKYKKITQCAENCIDPVYLPGDRLVFSRKFKNDTTGIIHLLFSCRLDGSDTRQITFHPHADFAPVILNDGRILTSTKQVFPETGNQYFMVLRPDGTKADRFYPGPDGGKILNRASETKDGRIVFVERGNGIRGTILSISINKPSGSKKDLTSDVKGSFYSIYYQSSGKFLVSYRPDEKDRYALYEFDTGNNKTGKLIYGDQEYNVTDAVVAEPYLRPKKLPSEVDMAVKTGQLLCQDINILGPETTGNAIPGKKIKRIEIVGIDSSMGIVEAEDDGSVYIKAVADTPFRIQTIDEEGKTVSGPSGWIWIRPNERRGCIGCHEDPELVPENRLSLAVKKMPVIIPVHIDKIKEKSVELE
jgi:hypothetical protein